MSTKFFKMQGCGNDFIFFDFVNGGEPVLRDEDVVALCDRHFGIGADGVVLLRPSQDADAGWYFYNCDGSSAEMCGNAARCAIRYLAENRFPGREIISLQTRVGVIKGKLLPYGRVEVTLLPHATERFQYEEKIIKTGDQALRVCCLNTGVPHAVIETEDLRAFPIADIGRLLVRHPVFPQGTNVTFFQRVTEKSILSTTFERGVERETYACGTGVAAAAILYTQLYLQPFPIEVTVPGGTLEVDISPVSKRLLLRGPAEYVAEGELRLDLEGFQARALFGGSTGKASHV